MKIKVMIYFCNLIIGISFVTGFFLAIWLLNHSSETTSYESIISLLTGFVMVFAIFIRSHLVNLSNQELGFLSVPKQFKNSSLTVKNAIEALHSPDKSDDAIKTLLNTEGKDAIDALAWAMEHPNRVIRKQAIFALAKETNYEDTRLLTKLLDLLHKDNENERLLLKTLKVLAKVLYHYKYNLNTTIPNSVGIIKQLIQILRKPYANKGINFWAQDIIVTTFSETSLIHLTHSLSEEKGASARIAIIETIERIINIQDIKIDKHQIIHHLIDVLGDNSFGYPPHNRQQITVNKLASRVLVLLPARDELISTLENRTYNPIQEAEIVNTLEKIGDESSLLTIQKWRNDNVAKQ